MQEKDIIAKKNQEAFRVGDFTQAKKEFLAAWATSCLVVLIIGLSFPIVLRNFFNTPYPVAAVISNSMWPAIREGDIVFIKGVRDRADLSVGDVIVFQNEHGFIIHRIVAMGPETVITKGDANRGEDQPIKFENVVGKAVMDEKKKVIRIPYLGKISEFFQSF